MSNPFTAVSIAPAATGLHLLSDADLSRIVRETLPADAQPGETVIVGDVNTHDARIVASFKRQASPKFSWELQGAAEHDWTGDNSVGGKVILRWK